MSVSTCVNCHQPVAPTDDICENCGVVLAPFVTPTVAVANSTPSQEPCPQCHAPRVPGVKFCNHCGYRFETATSPAASSAISQSNAPVQTTQLVTGSVLNGKYSIVKEIGAGGMGVVYRAAWQLARANQLPANITIAGVSSASPRVLGAAAEESYRQYLRREQYPANREDVVRRRLEVTPWHLL